MERGRKDPSLEPGEGSEARPTPSVSDFWPPGPGEDRFLRLKATQSAVLCYGGPRKSGRQLGKNKASGAAAGLTDSPGTGSAWTWLDPFLL